MRFELLAVTTLKSTVVWNTNYTQREIKEIKHRGMEKRGKKRRLMIDGNWI